MKITDVKPYPVWVGSRNQCLIKVETDAGVDGYGECHGSGAFAREAIAALEGPRLPHLGLIGKDPLAIDVHFHNMFYAYPQRGRVVRIWSGIDIALWDLAGKLLGQPVSKLLGGNFRDEIRLYSHCPNTGDFLDKTAWQDRAAAMKADPHGFTAFKVDIHSVLQIPMQQWHPSIGPDEARKIHKAYTLAREALGDEIDIIVHCHNELDVPGAIRVAAAVEHIQPLFYEDPLQPDFSEAWTALRRSTRLPVRLGYYYDPPHQIYTTVNNPLFRALYPEAEGRHHFTTGLGFFAGGSTRFDAALHFSQSHLELLITSVYTF